MGYFGENRNASGYLDPTAYLGSCGATAKPGEIWTRKWQEDEEYLVIKNHGGFCTTLKLTDEAVAAGIAVVSKRKRYTDPAMVGYTFSSTLGDFVKQLTDEAFKMVIRAVEDALSINLLLPPVETPDREADTEFERPKLENETLREEIENSNAAREKWEYKVAEKLDEARQRAAKAEGKLELLREMYDGLLKEVRS